eukprot:7826784-Alexandrium_andersonii.AAC.1
MLRVRHLLAIGVPAGRGPRADLGLRSPNGFGHGAKEARPHLNLSKPALVQALGRGPSSATADGFEGGKRLWRASG